MKHFMKSKTILGILVATVVSLAPVVGLNFSPDDGVFINDVVDKIFQAAGLVLAAYGRFVAKEKLSVKPQE